MPGLRTRTRLNSIVFAELELEKYNCLNSNSKVHKLSALNLLIQISQNKLYF